ncbi:MAG: HAMP domain-containing sensor histidine kinase [Archangium sp.]|nr:HAMP domain-containing sensor histidine kinase [Archangium sp.]MDP3158107.1 HAMP domain-containing sensor histidine kinase [Archangium sp.]MDP3570486.1 HAMP domain-containing sensor histidine kinase [Archangium sp.]
MRLVTRLSLAFLLVVICIISLNEFRQLADRQADFERDMDRTHQLVATALAESVKRVAPREGIEAAQATVKAINQRVAGDLRVRWVCGTNTEPTPFDCTALTRDLPVSTTRQQDGQAARRFTLVPVWEGGQLLGAVEVSESPAHEGEWVRQHLADAVLLSLMTIAGMTVASFALGWWLVAKPTRLLREKARAVGRGELAPDLRLSTRDELAEVADEMNAMCRQLAQARSDTEREAAARLAAVEQLRHADRLATVGRLASGLAHELGTPLNVVEARAGFIMDDFAKGEPAHESARVIVQCTEQMTRLIKQLLVFARPRTLEPVAMRLDYLARAVVDLVHPLASKRHVSLRVQELPEVRLEADEVLVQQALTNVVVNALMASREGSAVTLAIGSVETKKPGATEDRTWHTLAVRDEGEGMTPEVKASIFEPFFTTRPAGEGTGLGLAIALSIMEDHGGFMTVESVLGQGSTFTLHFPAEAR